MIRLIAGLALGAAVALTLPTRSTAQLCQLCVSEYWTCRWNAQSTRTSCLSQATSQSDRDQCWADYDLDLLYCGLHYNVCQDYCEA